MKRKTFIYIGGFELPDKNAAAHRVLGISTILSNLNIRTVFIGIDKEINKNSQILDTKKSVFGSDSYSQPYPSTFKSWINYLKNIDETIKVIESYDNIEAIILYNYQSLAFYKLLNYCKKKNIKVIADCTEWYGTVGLGLMKAIVKSLDTTIRMRFLHKKTDGLILISHYLDKYYSKSKNKVILPPTVDLSNMKWQKNTDKNIDFVYAGSPSKEKDKLNLVIDILYELRKSSDFSFYIIGISKEQYLDNYRYHHSLIDELSNNVFFLGRLSHQESLEYIKRAKYSIFFRDNNRVCRAGFPTKFVESISSRTPVITNETSDLKKYFINKEYGYLVDIQNKVETIDLLKNILNMNIDYSLDRDHSAELFKTFHYENFIQDLKIFLKNIIN